MSAAGRGSRLCICNWGIKIKKLKIHPSERQSVNLPMVANGGPQGTTGPAGFWWCTAITAPLTPETSAALDHCPSKCVNRKLKQKVHKDRRWKFLHNAMDLWCMNASLRLREQAQIWEAGFFCVSGPECQCDISFWEGSHSRFCMGKNHKIGFGSTARHSGSCHQDITQNFLKAVHFSKVHAVQKKKNKEQTNLNMKLNAWMFC